VCVWIPLANGARTHSGCGWFLEAAMQLKAPSGNCALHPSCYMARKKGCFISTTHVGFSNGYSVKRYLGGKQEREIIDSVRTQVEYMKWFNTIDRNNHDSADYLTTICTNCYYIRFFCCALYHVTQCKYTVLCWLVTNSMGRKEWRRYL
jgi:hypothetical protein